MALLILLFLWWLLRHPAQAEHFNDASYCEDNYYDLIQQFHLDGVVIVNATLSKTLKDGTDFRSSTA